MGTKAALGSGTFFKYKNHYAFITAGHVCLGPVFELWNSLPDGSKIITKVYLKSYTGQEIEGKIRYINIKYDTCIIDAIHPTVKSIPLFAIKKPVLYKEHYSISAPASIFHPGMVPVLKGMYVGDHKKFSFYTMPAAPGASGGPIYNSSNRIIGLVQRTHMLFPHITKIFITIKEH